MLVNLISCGSIWLSRLWFPVLPTWLGISSIGCVWWGGAVLMTGVLKGVSLRGTMC